MLIEFGCKGTTFFANNRLFLRIFVCELLELFFLAQSNSSVAFLANSRCDFQSLKTEEMKKAMIRAIENRPYSQ